MKAVCKKLFSLMLVAILLVSAVPFQASAEETVAPVTEAPTVATEAAVIEAAEEAADAEITATSPEAYAGVDLETGVVYVDFQLDSESDTYTVSEDWRVSLVKSKLGAVPAAPKGTAALNVLAKAIGSSEGYEFVRWYYINNAGAKVTYGDKLNVETMEFDSVTVNDVDYDSLNVFAEFQTYATNITLKANGGTVSTTKHKVELNKTYGEYGALPTPTRSGYVFQGWAKADGTLVDNDTVVTGLGALTAQWAAGKYTVTYKGYVGDGWDEVGFGSFTVDANSVMKTAFSNFPTDAQIDALFDIVEGWEIDGWEYSNDNEKTWNTFTAGKTKITATTTIRPLYKKTITLYACDTGNTKRTLTVTLDKNYPTLPHPGTRDGLAFMGWYTEADAAGDLISDNANLSNVAKHPVVTVDVGALYADWEEAKTVYLYIHTNGDTEDHAKLVKYYDVPATGFDLTTINLADIFPNYSKYDDKGDEKYGWYNETQWVNYCLGRQLYDTTESVGAEYFENDDIREFYIMLIDNGNNAANGNANGSNTGYNDNKTTVDSSNPSTGDNIMIPVMIMAVSACAVLLIFMNKKRIVK